MPFSAKLKGRYEIKGPPLGKGGMGVVYRAYDSVTKHEVAIKTIRDTPDRKALELFHRECDVLASMGHPNIVDIFDIGEFEEDGEAKPFFVMPLLRGTSLDDLIRTSSQRLTVERSVQIISETCRGLQVAHEHGLVHQDIKPGNIFVMDDDSVKIIDFGVAHMVDTRRSKGIRGTLWYMSPEQIELKPVTGLSDIFSLGVVCYETFTRRKPFDGPTDDEIADAILHRIPPPVSEINPTVSQLIGRAVHKALAKQSWNRYSTAREFGDTLRKALRNEPIEIFDLARIQPRIERARKAYEKANYPFAIEILTELEAEGHVDSEISVLHRQIDETLRKSSIHQLLENVRTRFEEEEYLLALQKVQEVLKLDPSNADAIGWQAAIEKKRNEEKIEDWIKLARQHIANHAYSHARQALQNVLQLRSDETRAQRLLAEVDWDEKEYLQLRQEKEQLYQAALEAWHDGEISTALSKLGLVLDLDRRAPDNTSPERAATYQSLYEQVRSEHDAINNFYAEARKNLTDRNFAKALAVCNEYLTKYPGHAIFQALKFDVEEQERQERSARIAEIDRRVAAEPDLDKRVGILKEAVARDPDEPHFERTLQLMRNRRDLVNQIVGRARLYEERSQFNEALGQWEILRNIYDQYPGLDFEIDRVIKRRDQQYRAEARAQWVDKIDRDLKSGSYDRATDLLQKAKSEFPEDPELETLGQLLRQRIDLKAQAQELLAKGQDLCAKSSFDEGVEILRQAHRLDERNPDIRAILVNILTQEADALLNRDWRRAEALVQEALDLDPAHARAKGLRLLISDRKREDFVGRCLSEARQLHDARDVDGALTRVDQGLEAYPSEPRLTQMRDMLNKERGGKVRLGRLEKLRQLEQDVNAIRDPEGVKGRLETIRDIADEYPSDAEFQSIVSNVERRLTVITMPAGVEKSGKSDAVPQLPRWKLKVLECSKYLKSHWHAFAASTDASFKRGKVLLLDVLSRVLGRIRAKDRKLPAGKLLIASTVVALLIAGLLLAPLIKRWLHPPPPPPTVIVYPLEVRTSPPGATIVIDNKTRGVSPHTFELQPGEHELKASIDGYRDETRNVTVASNAPPQGLEISLQPLDTAVRLVTDLKSGKVLLDGQEIGELQHGEFLRESLPVGKHNLTITRNAAQVITEFDVMQGAPALVHNLVSGTGLLAISVSNLGHETRLRTSFEAVNVGLAGQPPLAKGPDGYTLSNLDHGSYELMLDDGTGPYPISLEVTATPTLTIYVNANRNLGILEIAANEDAFDVYIDGKKEKRLVRDKKLHIPNLEPKQYAVRIAKDGFEAVPDQSVTVAKGGLTKTEFLLKPLKHAPEEASLSIQGAPKDTQIYLGGELLGVVAPDGKFSAGKVAPGLHTIELRKEGYKRKQIQREFGPGATAQLMGADVILEPEAAPLGTLEIGISPPDSHLSFHRVGENQIHVINGRRVELSDGAYILVATAPGHDERQERVQIEAGQTKQVEIRLSPTKIVEYGMEEWEIPDSWIADHDWFVHKGGEFVLYRKTPIAGSFEFSAAVRKTGILRKNPLQWVVAFRDPNNYVFFQISHKSFSRIQVINGQKKEQKISRTAKEETHYTLRISVEPNRIVHEIQDNGKWVSLDDWNEADRNFTEGKFGFLIEGKDEVAVTNFKFRPH